MSSFNRNVQKQTATSNDKDDTICFSHSSSCVESKKSIE